MPPIPNLNFSSPSSSGDAFGRSGGVLLGEYRKGISLQEIVLYGAVALIVLKLVK